MKKKLLLLTIGVLCFASFASADSFVNFPTRAAQNPTDFIDWSQLGPAITLLPSSPQLVSTFNGNLALVGNTNGSPFYRIDEGNGWGGGFDYGETLVWTGNPNFNPAGFGPFAIVLANPVGTVGFQVEADLIAPYIVTVDLYDIHGNLLLSQSYGGAPCGSGNGCVPFYGVGDLSGPNIGAIVISTNSGDPFWNNDFALNDPSFGVIPEPGSLVLLGSGLLGLAGIARRKLNR